MEWDSTDLLGSRTPLVIIHGWNPDTVPGRPKLDPLWDPFFLKFMNDVSLKTRYKIYFFTYYSNVVSVEELGRRLQDDLASKDRQNSIFASRSIVILAHSMGGLVARSYMNQFSGRSRVLRLITLGTPHHGSPMANGPARDSKTLGLWSLAQILFDNLYFSVFGPAWYTPNRSDLRWDNYDGLFNYSLFSLERNTWLENLNSDRTYDNKIIAYYGNYAPSGDCTGVFAPFASYCYGSTLLGGAMGLVSDGIVPVSSASFVDVNSVPRVVTRSFDGYNHEDIVAGKGDSRLFNSIRTDLLNVTVPGPVPLTDAPFGSFDTPADYSILSGEVAMTGWALDDGGVTRVDIYRSAVRGEVTPNGLIYVGSPTFVTGTRPDITNHYPSLPNNNRAGWGYMLMTNLLPGQGNEGFLFVAYAYDAEGNMAGLGGKNLNFNNRASVKPFGTLDTPAQGETVSGLYTNFGWVLTPQPNVIAFNGSTIDVYIDNVALGHPVYNNYRSDIAGLFPGLRNTNGAVGYFQFDTRRFVNGLHTIAWFVRDSAGNIQGIGSRYFTIRN